MLLALPDAARQVSMVDRAPLFFLVDDVMLSGERHAQS